MARPVYPSDLTDAEWAVLSSLLPPAPPGGRPRSVNSNAAALMGWAVLSRACRVGPAVPGRYLPCDDGPWSTVYHSLRQVRRDGTWERIHAHLRELARERAGREPTPSVASIDSQSVKTHQGSPRGFGGRSRRQEGEWRKRHVVVATRDLLLKVVVHPADLHDRLGANLVVGALGTEVPRLHHSWADQGDAGALHQWTREHLGIELEVVYPWWRTLQRYFLKLLGARGFQPGFPVLPRRWVVERTCAWLGRSRQLSRDYERLPTRRVVRHSSMSPARACCSTDGHESGKKASRTVS